MAWHRVQLGIVGVHARVAFAVQALYAAWEGAVQGNDGDGDRSTHARATNKCAAFIFRRESAAAAQLCAAASLRGALPHAIMAANVSWRWRRYHLSRRRPVSFVDIFIDFMRGGDNIDDACHGKINRAGGRDESNEMRLSSPKS